MTRSILFNRMPRVREPLPDDEVKVPGPPKVQPPTKMNWFQTLLPVAGVFIMAGVYGGARGDWLLALPMVAMSGLSVIGSFVGRATQRKEQKRKLAESEAAYAEALRIRRAELEEFRRTQQRIHHNNHPDLNAVVMWAQQHDAHLWGRQPTDDDFLHVRVGVGTLPSSVEVSAPDPDMPDPALEEALQIQSEYQQVPSVPVTVDLTDGPATIVGAASQRRKAARALLIHLITHHSPDEVVLASVYLPGHDAAWEWIRWLPHAYVLDTKSPFQTLGNDSQSARDMLDSLLEELHRRQNLLHNQPQHTRESNLDLPWIVVLVEDFSMVRNAPAIHLLLSPEGQNLNAVALFLADSEADAPQSTKTIVRCYPDNTLDVVRTTPGHQQIHCTGEFANRKVAETVVRALAPLHVYTLLSDDTMPTYARLFDMLKILDMDRHDMTSDWDRHQEDQFLMVPIGVRRGNQILTLDLNHTGHGPHGLVAGTTGSGKSELLQTMVVSLALKHHPYDLGFVMVDFKGGGTFAQLQYLPHTLGMVTDLSGALAMRALVALEAEVDRRKRLFNEANVNDITPYQKAYWRTQIQGSGDVSVPLPHLVIIVDEFAELVSDYPEFMAGLIAIARVGRSLGLHLILATQSPGGVVNQQIWANAKFRICLRVESRQESMDMLHRAEAANLPRVPGRGYLQVGNNDVFELFQVARVAGTYRKKGQTNPLRAPEKPVFIAEVSRLGHRTILFDSQAKKSKPETAEEKTDIDVTVDASQTIAEDLGIEPLPSPWPEPLPQTLLLPDLLRDIGYTSWAPLPWNAPKTSLSAPKFCGSCGGALREGAKFCLQCGARIMARCPNCMEPVALDAVYCENCGQSFIEELTEPEEHQSQWLTMVLGMVDDPAHQRQYPLEIGLSEQDGHLLVFGVPGSGRDMLVRTLITSLALTHTPDQLNFYMLEFGGGLRAFESLPHVGGVFLAGEHERIQRLLRKLLDELEGRKQLCNEAEVDALIHLRKAHPDQVPPAIVLVLTGFAEFRTNFMEEMLPLMRLLREGSPYGIHFVLTGNRPGDIPSSVSSIVTRRIVLALADAADYSMAIGATLKVAKNQKLPYGRGWYGRPPLAFQTAIPGREVEKNQQAAALQQLIELLDQSWDGQRPEKIEALPQVVSLRTRVLDKIPSLPTPTTSVPVGIDGLRMLPAFVDLIKDGPDFIVTSTQQGGKTTLLLTWALMLAEYNSPQDLQFILIAGRRNSLQLLEELPHVLDYCRTPDSFKSDEVLLRLAAEVDRREQALTQRQVTQDGLSHIVMVIDDYDEFNNRLGLSQDRTFAGDLESVVKKGRDVNVHTIVTGPTNNLGVSISDPVFKYLKLGRSGFALHLLDADPTPLNLRLRSRDVGQDRLPPGRGYIVRNGDQSLIQIAMCESKDELDVWVDRLGQRWSDQSEPAAWPSEVWQRIEAEEGAQEHAQEHVDQP